MQITRPYEWVEFLCVLNSGRVLTPTTRVSAVSLQTGFCLAHYLCSCSVSGCCWSTLVVCGVEEDEEEEEEEEEEMATVSQEGGPPPAKKQAEVRLQQQQQQEKQLSTTGR
jgi:hypothetical protein